MLLMLDAHLQTHEINSLIEKLSWMGIQAIATQDEGEKFLIVVSGLDEHVNLSHFTELSGIRNVVPLTQKYKLGSRIIKKNRTIISAGSQVIGDPSKVVIMAGPCAIENEQQIEQVAAIVAKCGGTILRGGAYKPRTSPYDFQGLENSGLKLLETAAKKYNLLTISEVMSIEQIDVIATHIDILQIGARNMQNFNLLRAVAKSNKPILLKRGLSATYMEWLLAAEYILSSGNPNVILCERGIRTFETYTRNTLDLAAVPVLKELSHLPIIVDPSHGVGIRQFVPDLARAAIAAGADGVMVEIHPNPEKALSDGPQSLTFPQFEAMMLSLHKIAAAVEKTIPDIHAYV